jgi:hypothetical protein
MGAITFKFQRFQSREKRLRFSLVDSVVNWDAINNDSISARNGILILR